MHPILFIDLFKQSSYKTTILLSMMHKQKTYFAKKYSKLTRITLSKINKLLKICEKDNIKAVQYIHKKINIINYTNFVHIGAEHGCIKIVRYFINNNYNEKEM